MVFVLFCCFFFCLFPWLQDAIVIDNSSEGNRVSTDRCAHLIAVSMVNGLDEVWVAKQPILFFVYASQYLPAFAKRYSHLNMPIVVRLKFFLGWEWYGVVRTWRIIVG